MAAREDASETQEILSGLAELSVSWSPPHDSSIGPGPLTSPPTYAISRPYRPPPLDEITSAVRSCTLTVHRWDTWHVTDLALLVRRSSRRIGQRTVGVPRTSSAAESQGPASCVRRKGDERHARM
ncbi:hypothetical protein SCP_0116730 [Sparassis crispa]|uniref:Uncharacterized protein n=1 Tax=Sparassis crispa TaxID=139825 RepID=A0A401G9D4_9APHY|nr:hypothetical protein SCP_0116730 [Sparassis crispa]GBE78780.1 hypothetical protein SCP_0116730 [Sparassis crispa]